jgi:hypothetical protein
MILICLDFLFVWGASPGSAGCFKKATQTTNAMLEIPKFCINY